jgi:hypothetical protein
MKSKLSLLLLFIFALPLFILSCSNDTTTEPGDDNNNTTGKDSLSFEELSISGVIKKKTMQSTKYVLAPWEYEACDFEARLNDSKTNVVGTGKINSDGSFTLKFKKSISKTPFMTYADMKILLLGNNVTFTPANVSTAYSIRTFAVVNNKGTKEDVEIFCDRLNASLTPLESWSPVVYSADGSINGTDMSGNVWNSTFKKGWYFFSETYDVPTKGKMTYSTAASIPASATWYYGY